MVSNGSSNGQMPPMRYIPVVIGLPKGLFQNQSSQSKSVEPTQPYQGGSKPSNPSAYPQQQAPIVAVQPIYYPVMGGPSSSGLPFQAAGQQIPFLPQQGGNNPLLSVGVSNGPFQSQFSVGSIGGPQTGSYNGVPGGFPMGLPAQFPGSGFSGGYPSTELGFPGAFPPISGGFAPAYPQQSLPPSDPRSLYLPSPFGSDSLIPPGAGYFPGGSPDPLALQPGLPPTGGGADFGSMVQSIMMMMAMIRLLTMLTRESSGIAGDAAAGTSAGTTAGTASETTAGTSTNTTAGTNAGTATETTAGTSAGSATAGVASAGVTTSAANSIPDIRNAEVRADLIARIKDGDEIAGQQLLNGLFMLNADDPAVQELINEIAVGEGDDSDASQIRALITAYLNEAASDLNAGQQLVDMIRNTEQRSQAAEQAREDRSRQQAELERVRLEQERTAQVPEIEEVTLKDPSPKLTPVEPITDVPLITEVPLEVAA